MTVVDIPEGCTSIGANAFKDCANLTQIRIPASVTSIDTTAFESCAKVLVYGTTGSPAETFCAYAAKEGMVYTRDDDLHRSPFGMPPVVCNYFYHEEVKKSAKKGKQ